MVHIFYLGCCWTTGTTWTSRWKRWSGKLSFKIQRIFKGQRSILVLSCELIMMSSRSISILSCELIMMPWVCLQFVIVVFPYYWYYHVNLSWCHGFVCSLWLWYFLNITIIMWTYRDAMGLSAVCDCGISLILVLSCELMIMPWVFCSLWLWYFLIIPA